MIIWRRDLQNVRSGWLTRLAVDLLCSALLSLVAACSSLYACRSKTGDALIKTNGKIDIEERRTAKSRH